MSGKPRKIVWDKRHGKFIPSSILKKHAGAGEKNVSAEPATPGQADRKKVFARNLLAQIRKAVRG